ncbi:phosphoribosyltransferase family protein [Kitasatospora sp. CB01950]|uniref:phosphoribosyltransferase family protein n=1 Tax=Kitasatospora sp. CB01950 TaxID=1703930 RepID=UPI00093F0357|nr:phosphoribosyltransferase family protein [Kitasatospora sp. CB01950]OKJ16038.1 phosphoribosyl transferase [Kitasatospora sp. CB01950]
MDFTDRTEAGRRLAAALTGAGTLAQDAVVVALPRGGVPVAVEVAAALDAPLDVCVIRKVGVPGQPEVAMGAVGEDGTRVVNQTVVDAAGVTPEQFAAVEAHERAELARRAAAYREGREPVPLAGRTVVVVDDGVATGSTALAACRLVRARGAARVVLAVPVAPYDWTSRLAGAADAFVAVHTPSQFLAVGEFYRDFRQVEDAEVLTALERAGRSRPVVVGEHELAFPTGPAAIAVPEHPVGVVLFAHGSGSGRGSPRNRRVAARLHREGLATVLFDLLTPHEAEDRRKVFDPGLLGGRLSEATRTVRRHPPLTGLPFGYFGASTGAAAALWAAAERDAEPGAVVSRGGRPDLARARLPLVTAPTLLIVGGADQEVVELNRQARSELRCESALQIVPGAGHLFEEPGALEAVADLAAQWFARHLAAGRQGGDRARH